MYKILLIRKAPWKNREREKKNRKNNGGKKSVYKDKSTHVLQFNTIFCNAGNSLFPILLSSFFFNSCVITQTPPQYILIDH